MFVLTIDQRDSRKASLDLEEALRVASKQAHKQARELHGIDTQDLPAAEVTVGDEIQAVFDRPEVLTSFMISLHTYADWHVGVGIGPAKLPASGSVRHGEGEAFWNARQAVEEAKGQGARVIGGAEPYRTQAQAVLRAITHILQLRTAHQRETVQVYRSIKGPAPQREVARLMNVSVQAVSKTLSRAAVDLEDELTQVLAQLLNQAHQEAQ